MCGGLLRSCSCCRAGDSRGLVETGSLSAARTWLPPTGQGRPLLKLSGGSQGRSCGQQVRNRNISMAFKIQAYFLSLWLLPFSNNHGSLFAFRLFSFISSILFVLVFKSLASGQV